MKYADYILLSLLICARSFKALVICRCFHFAKFVKGVYTQNTVMFAAHVSRLRVRKSASRFISYFYRNYEYKSVIITFNTCKCGQCEYMGRFYVRKLIR